MAKDTEEREREARLVKGVPIREPREWQLENWREQDAKRVAEEDDLWSETLP